MELGLSLGDASKPFGFMEKPRNRVLSNGSLGLCMGLSIGSTARDEEEQRQHQHDKEKSDGADADDHTTEQGTKTSFITENGHERVDPDPPVVQLDLLPLAPVPRHHPSQLAFPWLSDNGASKAGSSGQIGLQTRGFDVNRLPPPAATAAEEVEDGAALSSSPNNSATSSFQMDFYIYRGGNNGSGSGGNKRDHSSEAFGNDVGGDQGERASSRASDEDENGSTRKKLRLSKEQSAFLEESFKEHNTLNPKQKLALAKQLNLRPRQVEVWFQNRRARTKLKQTEVDCEYLKRCCETLTEENRRLHKELQELRALKTSNPFYMQLPATTLTMCPSCERVATTSTSAAATTTTTTTIATKNNEPTSKLTPFSLSRPRFYPFSHTQTPPSNPSNTAGSKN